jgi:hypothetical protein
MGVGFGGDKRTSDTPSPSGVKKPSGFENGITTGKEPNNPATIDPQDNISFSDFRKYFCLLCNRKLFGPAVH